MRIDPAPIIGACAIGLHRISMGRPMPVIILLALIIAASARLVAQTEAACDTLWAHQSISLIGLDTRPDLHEMNADIASIGYPMAAYDPLLVPGLSGLAVDIIGKSISGTLQIKGTIARGEGSMSVDSIDYPATSEIGMMEVGGAVSFLRSHDGIFSIYPKFGVDLMMGWLDLKRRDPRQVAGSAPVGLGETLMRATWWEARHYRLSALSLDIGAVAELAIPIVSDPERGHYMWLPIALGGGYRVALIGSAWGPVFTSYHGPDMSHFFVNLSIGLERRDRICPPR